MPVTDSPLRYPGGKTQLASLVIDIMKRNDLIGGTYAEPFAGGAGIACKLLVNGYVTQIAINDIDPAVYAFWQSVLKQTDALVERIEATPVTMDEWYRQKAVFESPSARILDRGFATLFLNRTNRSGILKAGVIGGKAQAGDYLLDCRFNKVHLIQKIQRIALYKECVSLSRLDAVQFLRERVPLMSKWTLVNIDPPYYLKGEALYTSFYQPEDHKALSKVVGGLKRPWMVTYDDAPEIAQLYRKFPTVRAQLLYSAQVKRSGIELLVTKPGLELPGDLMGKAAA